MAFCSTASAPSAECPTRSRYPPGPSRHLLTHMPRRATPTYARRAGARRAPAGDVLRSGPDTRRAWPSKTRAGTSRARAYADAVRRRIASKVSANVVDRRRFMLLVAYAPDHTTCLEGKLCARRSGSRSRGAPSNAVFPPSPRQLRRARAPGGCSPVYSPAGARVSRALRRRARVRLCSGRRLPATRLR